MKPVEANMDVLRIQTSIRDLAKTSVDWSHLSSVVSNEFGDAYLDFAYEAFRRNKNRQHITESNAMAESTSTQNISRITLNKKARQTLFATAIVLVCAVLFPPFQITVQGGGMTISQGFKFIGTTESYTGVVNTPLLLCEFFVILIVGFIATLLHQINE